MNSINNNTTSRNNERIALSLILEGLIRAFKGFIFYLLLEIFFSLLNSSKIGTGNFNFVFSPMEKLGGSELKGAMIQFSLTAAFSLLMAFSTIIWEIKKIKLPIKILINYMIIVPTVVAVAFFTSMMAQLGIGFLLWTILASVAYAAITAMCLLITKKKSNS